MWEESWVPKIGDFGLAAEAIVEGENENGEPILLPTPISPHPPSPRFPDYTTTAPSTTDDNSESLSPVEKTSASTTPTNTTTISAVSGGGRPKRPKPKRTRTVGVGTRTVSFLF